MAKVKLEIDLLKPRQDQIWLGFKRIDGSDDGKWLDIKYEKVPSYCLYCKMEGHYDSQCRTKIREERIKAQRKEHTRKEREQMKDKDNGGDFQTVFRKKGAKARLAQQNDQQTKNNTPEICYEDEQNENQDQINFAFEMEKGGKKRIGISIIEPLDNQRAHLVTEAPGKGKGKDDDIHTNNNFQVFTKVNNRKKRNG